MLGTLLLGTSAVLGVHPAITSPSAQAGAQVATQAAAQAMRGRATQASLGVATPTDLGRRVGSASKHVFLSAGGATYQVRSAQPVV